MKITRLRGTGTGDMGDATDPNSIARFGSCCRYGLLYLRATFSENILGNGAAGNATMQLKLDDRADTNLYNFLLAQWLTRGLGASATAFVNWRLRNDELSAWVFDGGAQFVLEWANPDPTKMRWAVELGLYDAS